MSDAPIVPGSDEWFQKIGDILTDSQGGAPVTDAAIAALVSGISTLTNAAVKAIVAAATSGLLDTANANAGALDTALRASIVDAFTNADSQVLEAAKAYADNVAETAGVTADYVDDSSAHAVVTANAYTDDVSSQTLTTANQYTDAQALAVGGNANQHADDGDAATLTSANAYTDATASTVVGNLLSTMDAKDATVAQTTLAAAIQYVIDHPGGGASSAYVDNGDATALAAAKTYADNGAATNLAAAKSYADTGDTAAKTYADNKDVTALAAAKAYADQYAVTDSGWLAITPPSGFTDRDSLSYRKRGTRVELRGGLNISTGSIAAITPLFTLPAGFRPTTYVVKSGPGSGVTYARVDINTGGVVSISAVSGTTTYLYFNSIEFYTD